MNDSQASALETFDQQASSLATMISNQVKTTASPPATITPAKDHVITCDSTLSHFVHFFLTPSEVQPLPKITTGGNQNSEYLEQLQF